MPSFSSSHQDLSSSTSRWTTLLIGVVVVMDTSELLRQRRCSAPENLNSMVTACPGRSSPVSVASSRRSALPACDTTALPSLTLARTRLPLALPGSQVWVVTDFCGVSVQSGRLVAGSRAVPEGDGTRRTGDGT